MPSVLEIDSACCGQDSRSRMNLWAIIATFKFLRRDRSHCEMGRSPGQTSLNMKRRRCALEESTRVKGVSRLLRAGE